jgi:hypothetical protein
MSANIVYGGQNTDGYVALASSRLNPQGKLYRKQILPWGDFKYGGNTITIDEKFADSLIKNFSAGYCDIVQVPIVDDKNRHSEDPTRNIGRVVDVERGPKGVYAIIDAVKYADDLGKTLIGASAMMSTNYTDTKTGKHVGPTLLHCAVTNRPYITNLDDFDEVIAMSVDTSEEETVLLGAANTEEKVMPKTREELLAELKKDHGIDVEALQAQVAEKDTKVTELSASVEEKDAKIVELSGKIEEKDAEVVELAAKVVEVNEGDEVSLADVGNAIVELSAKIDAKDAQIVELSGKVDEIQAEKEELRTAAAESEVEGYIKTGRILPKQRERMIKLSLEDREAFEDLLPENAIVTLSESGVTSHQDTNSDEAKEQQSETERLAKLARELAGIKE